MSLSLFVARRWCAALLLLNVLNVLAVQPAQAAPATKESLTRYFEVNHVAALVSRATESIGAAKAKEWQDETDPAAKAAKKAQFDKMDAIIRKYVTWKALEPIAVESYQRRLDEADVLALIAYAESPSGQVRVNKLSPAVLEIMPPVFAYMEKRVDEISDRKEGTPAPAVPAPVKPVAGSKEALALTLLTEMPGARDEFKQRMGGMEKAMLSAAAMAGGEDNAAVTAQLKRLAGQLQREITFEEIVALQARLLANKLTEAEFTMLINEHRNPALNKLLAKQQLADREFGVGANQYMAEKILPGLMRELMAATQPAAKKKPSKKDAKP